MTLGGRRLAGLAAMAIAALAVGAGETSAASRVCRQLEAQLAGATGGTGSAAQVRKYDRAIERQREQLSKARANARRAGCTFTLFGRDRCSAINAQIERMETNLDSLQGTRSRLSGGGTSRSERARILASIEANGCRDSETVVASRRLPPALTARGRDGVSLFDQLRRDGDTTETTLMEQADGVYGPAGSYRTMCVRTCDGYFFPMSARSSGRDFGRDLQNCEAMCPGTEMQLYYQGANAENSDEMVSAASGEAYMSLPTAYQYKQVGVDRPAGCGCNPTKGFALLGDGAKPVDDRTASIPLPAGRPDPAADPETIANLEGGLDAATVGRLLKPKAALAAPPVDPADRKVRVVGPAFLPDQEGAIDLRAPGQKKVQ
ncbi:MAG: DUF2865 domain-containing protein [Rhizobiaceae bacterium]|nr:DUF2865 domain-containing protein [Rhizobiaceae bacterium]